MQRVDSEGGGSSGSPFFTVACVLQSGGIYTPDWVAQLKEGVDRHLSGHRFVCLSDVDVPCERIPLERKLPRYWCKMEVFRPGLFDGPVLYIDLDSVIVGPLDDLFRDRLTMIPDFMTDGVNGSVMSWSSDYSYLWRLFMADPERIITAYDMRGSVGGLDQGFVSDHARPHDLFERGRIVSYKVDCRGRGLPSGARIVQFHGIPKYTDVSEDWIA